jgi:hypothetical protein
VTAETQPKFKHGDTPGRGGYRKGCKCEQCRRGQREYQRKYRARRSAREAVGEMPEVIAPPEFEESSAKINWNAPAGPIELALADELDSLVGEPPFKKTLMVLAKYNARVLDQIPEVDRFDLVSGMQSRLFNVFDRLRRVEVAPGAKDSWDMSGLLSPDPMPTGTDED